MIWSLCKMSSIHRALQLGGFRAVFCKAKSIFLSPNYATYLSPYKISSLLRAALLITLLEQQSFVLLQTQ